MITVRSLALAPVKGLRLAAADEVQLRENGVAGDRAYLVVDAASHELLLTTRTPRLVQVRARVDGEALTLAFPDGSVASAIPEPRAPASTATYDGREVRGRLVEGALAAALSEHLGRAVALLARDEAEQGADDAPVTLMSEGSLEALAPALGGDVPDGRRFRMNLTVDGVEAWEEHGWAGHELAVGGARLRGLEPVPRCAVTTRDPDDGHRDQPTLKALAQLRGKRDVTFGIWCEVLAPGRVRVGDALTLG